MSTTQDSGLESINPYNPPEGFSAHIEPPEVGGERYWKCDHCGTESIYWNKRDLTSECVHSDDCDNPVVGGDGE